MSETEPGVPPLEDSEEPGFYDKDFAGVCEDAINQLLVQESDLQIIKIRYTISKQFGSICRADFKSSDEEEGTVNRLMFWKLEDGDLAKFFGLNLPTSPL